MHGQFVWYDLMTSDPAAAQRFYPQFTGWKTQKFEQASADMPYTMWTSNGEAIGGVAQLTREQAAMGTPPSWLAAVSVNNIDESARLAASLGGKVVVPPMPIPDTGRYAVIQDPQGATIALFQANQPTPGFDGTNVVGRPSWHELTTTDYVRAFDFYRQMFGWEKTSEFDMGPHGKYLMYGMKGKRFGGMFNRTPDMGQVPPFWLPYIHVTDVKKSADAATRAGGKIKNEPMEVPGGDMIAVLADPQGAVFALHQVAPKAKAKRPKAKARKPKAKRPKAKRPKARKPKAKARKPKAKAKAKKPKAKAKKPKAKNKKKARRR